MLYHNILKLFALLVFALMVPISASAQSFTATGMYLMGDNDSPKFAKSEARTDAMRLITEQAGTYVESYSQSQDNTLSQDDVTTIAASIVRVTHEEPATITPYGNGQLMCSVTLTAEADTSGLDVKKILEHKTVVQAAEKARESGRQENSKLAERYAYANSSERSDIERLVNANDDKDFILQEAAKAIATGKPDRALRILKVHEYDGWTHRNFYFNYFYGVALYDMGKIEDANSVFSAVENNFNQTHSEMFRAKYYLGVIAYKDGWYPRAYHCLKFAWEHSPQDDDAMKDWYIKAYEAYVDNM